MNRNEMKAHECIQEKEIGRIVGLLETIVKEFYGNGQKGIAREFPELKSSLNNLNITVEALRIDVSALNKTILTIQTIDIYKEKESLSTRQKTAIIVSAIIGVAGIVTSIIISL